MEKIRKNKNLNININNIFQIEFLSILLFIGVLISLIIILLDYNIVWNLPEVHVWRPAIINETNISFIDSLLQTFNWQLMENAARVSRPISNFFEVLDAIFREWFANNVFPHPSISLSWIFTIILSPIYIYKIIKLIIKENYYRWLAISLYIMNSGFLSLVVMSFRPGKAIASFLLIYIFYKSLKIFKFSTKNNTIEKFLLLLTIYISLFVDEIMVFSLLIIMLIIWNKFLSELKFIFGLLVVSILYFLTLEYLLPYIAYLAGYPIPDTLNYTPKARFVDILTFNANYSEYISLFKGFLLNFKIVFNELSSFAILNDKSNQYIFPLIILFFMYIVLILNIIKSIITKNDNESSNILSYLSIVLMFIFSIIFHTSLMLLVDHGVWGVYWYGIFIILPWTILVIITLQKYSPNKTFTFLFILLTISGSIYSFISTNFSYKHYHYYPYRPSTLQVVFLNMDNRYDLFREHYNKYSNLFNETKNYYNTMFEKVDNEYAELTYLNYELSNHTIVLDDFIGKYKFNNLGTTISKNRDEIIICNERNECTKGNFIHSKLYAINWKIHGSLNKKKNKLIWENGSIWEKVNEN